MLSVRLLECTASFTVSMICAKIFACSFFFRLSFSNLSYNKINTNYNNGVDSKLFIYAVKLLPYWSLVSGDPQFYDLLISGNNVQLKFFNTKNFFTKTTSKQFIFKNQPKIYLRNMTVLI